MPVTLVDELLEIVEWLISLIVGPESSLYGGFDLQEGDDDGGPNQAPTYGGANRPGLAGAGYVQALHADLREFGILLAPDGGTAFDRRTRWAVREFQAYATMDQAAYEREPSQAALTAQVAANAGTIPVDTSDGFPEEVPFRLRIADEVLEVTGGARTTQLTVLRAREDTQAAIHQAGAAVVLSRWAARLDPDGIAFYERYSGRITGVVNAGTRVAIERWKSHRWRVPVAVEAWEMRRDPPPNGPLRPFRIFTIPAAGNQPARRADNIWLADEVTTAPRIFVRDLSDYWERPDARPEDGPTEARMTVLGTAFVYVDPRDAPNQNIPAPQKLRWVGPVALPENDHTWSPEGEMLPENLVEEDEELDEIDDPARLSTYKVVRSVAEWEALGYFDSVNAYDHACVSLGPCHWTGGMRVYQAFGPARQPVERWDMDEGELWAFLAYVQDTEPDDAEQLLGNFGVGVTPAWGDPGLREPGQRKYEGRGTLTREVGAPTELLGRAGSYGRVGDYEMFRTWHWFYRWVMAGRTLDGFRRRMWDMARIRIRDILTAPWDPPAPAAASIPDIPAAGNQPARRVVLGDLFRSERTIALVYRWHIFAPVNVIANGRAAQGLRNVMAAAQSNQAPVQPAWNVPPTQWGNQHEQALEWAILNRAVPANVRATLADVAAWPASTTHTWQARRQDRGYQLAITSLPANERQLRLDRGSFQFEDEGLP